MTRSTIRLAQICGAALAAGVVSAALAQSTWAGLASTARLLAVLGACGVVASLGWHGTAAAVERREEQLRAERRHRVPRPDRVPARTAAPADAAGAWPDPYAPDTDPVPQGARRYWLNDETHVHSTSSPA